MRGRPLPEGWKRPYLEARGLRLRELRIAAGLSREDLAQRLGSTRSYVNKLESGRHAPGQEMSAKLAAALGVSVADLAPRSPAQTPPSHPL